MHIQLRFFASLREAVGVAEESVELPASVRTVGAVREFLKAREGVWAESLDEKKSLRMACNHTMARPDTPITDGCEVAFFPPVTGG